MEAASFTSTSQFLTAKSSSSSSSSTTSYPSFSSTSQSLYSLRYKPHAKALNCKSSRSFSVRASAGGADDSVVTLLDYGAGNVRSLRNAIKYLGFDIKDVQTPEDILKAKRLIFPGVGAFAPAMDVLNKKGMAEALCTYIEQDRPFLGICLGLQLLFESSEENGPVKGLGLIPGVVGRFDSSKGIRVPHIGWNALDIAKDTQILDDIGKSNGLGLIPGVVGRFDSSKGIRVPHIGWNALDIAKDTQILDDIGKSNGLGLIPGVVGRFDSSKGIRVPHIGWNALDIAKDTQILDDIGKSNGLGLIPGVVGRFDSSKGIRVPHIGWNALDIAKDTQILDDIGKSHVYFVHSYRATPSDDNREWISSTCKYGDNFIASIQRGNVHAVQFHPEKSGDVGLSVLRRFLNPKSGRTQKLVQGNASKLAKRVIACLDVRTNDKGDLVVTKGDQYDVREHTKENEVRNLGKPVDLAGQYYKDGADEVSFLNITAFRDFPLGDLPMLQVLRYASENVFVPLTVGGGIRDFKDGNGRYYSSLEVASEYFRSGADKVSIGSDAVYAAEEYLKSGVKTGKSSLEQISRVYGNQAVVVSIDPRRVYVRDPKAVEFRTIKVRNPGPNGEEYAWYQCTVSGGREGRPIGAYELAKAVEELGAGEILLNCIDCDGQGKGFDIDLIKLISDAVSIPVIASSGAGTVEHFSEVFKETNASAALAAGIFHRKEVPIQSVKEHLVKEGIEVRM